MLCILHNPSVRVDWQAYFPALTLGIIRAPVNPVAAPYNRSMVWLLLLLLPAPGFAQTKAGPQRWPIERLTVEGLKNYSLQQALAATGLKTGQLAGRQDFEAARDRLLAT